MNAIAPSINVVSCTEFQALAEGPKTERGHIKSNLSPLYILGQCNHIIFSGECLMHVPDITSYLDPTMQTFDGKQGD